MDVLSMARELVIAVGGPLWPGAKLKNYFDQVSSRTGLSVRVIKAAWHGEQASRETIATLKIAAGKHEARNLAARFEHLARSLNVADADFHRDDVAALVDAARALRGLDRSGDR